MARDLTGLSLCIGLRNGMQAIGQRILDPPRVHPIKGNTPSRQLGKKGSPFSHLARATPEELMLAAPATERCKGNDVEERCNESSATSAVYVA